MWVSTDAKLSPFVLDFGKMESRKIGLRKKYHFPPNPILAAKSLHLIPKKPNRYNYYHNLFAWRTKKTRCPERP